MANPWDDDEIIAPAAPRAANRTFYNPPQVPSSLDVGGLYGSFRQTFPGARVTSTRRSPEENARLPNSAPDSFHLTGEAWDAVPASPDEERALVAWGTGNGLQVKVERAPYHVHFEPPARGIATSTIDGGGAGSTGGNPWDGDEIIDADAVALDEPAGDFPTTYRTDDSGRLEIDIVGATGNATPEEEAAWAQMVDKAARPADTRAQMVADERRRVVDDMSGGERFIVGAGKSVDDTIRGTKQLAAMSWGNQSAVAADMLERAGLSDAAAFLRSNVSAPAYDTYTREIEAERQAREANAPLMDTWQGMAGNVVGTGVQYIGPGGVAKLATRVPAIARSTAAPVINQFAAMALPTSVRGNALLGAGIGAVQPVVSEGERGTNVLVNAGGGAAGTMLVPVAGAVVRGGQRVVPAMREASQKRAAARVINEFAENPAALRAAAANPQTIVQGTRPTLAETSEDLGLAGLQDTLASTSRDFGVALTRRQQSNNLARVEAIRAAFGGADDAAAAAIREERDRAAATAARALRNVRNPPPPAPAAPQSNPFGSLGGVPVPPPPVTQPALVISLEPVDKALTALAAKADRRPAVQSALQYVRSLTREPVRSADEAWNLRKTIGDLMDGKLGGDQAAATTARRELMVVRGILDREMAKAYPGWGKFLREYKGASRVADQVDVGSELLATGRAVRASTNDPQLTAAAFSRAAGNMDRTVQRATGFRRASADRTLTTQQLQAVDDVRRDLERFARTQQDALPANSATVRRATGANEVRDAVGPVGAAMVEPASGAAMLVLNSVRKNYGEKVMGVVQEAMLDPARAAEILATLDPTVRQRVLRQVAPYVQRALSSAGVSLPATVSAGED